MRTDGNQTQLSYRPISLAGLVVAVDLLAALTFNASLRFALPVGYSLPRQQIKTQPAANKHLIIGFNRWWCVAGAISAMHL